MRSLAAAHRSGQERRPGAQGRPAAFGLVSGLLDAADRRRVEPLVLVGSSMGGHVATAAAGTVNAVGLFVLAPAYYMPGYEDLTPPAPTTPMVIVHGWGDDIVPVENSIRYAGECRATLHVVDGDHRLTANIDEICDLLRRFIESLS